MVLSAGLTGADSLVEAVFVFEGRVCTGLGCGVICGTQGELRLPGLGVSDRSSGD